MCTLCVLQETLTLAHCKHVSLMHLSSKPLTLKMDSAGFLVVLFTVIRRRLWWRQKALEVMHLAVCAADAACQDSMIQLLIRSNALDCFACILRPTLYNDESEDSVGELATSSYHALSHAWTVICHSIMVLTRCACSKPKSFVMLQHRR